MAYASRKKCNLQVERLETRDCPTGGALDTTFGNTGIAFADFGVADDWGGSVAIQADGKSVVAGYSAQPGPTPKRNQPAQTQLDFAIARFNVDGTLDTTFGAGGKVLTDFQSKSSDAIASVAIQSDGKIVVAGTSDGRLAIARYNTDGTLDTSFDADGKVTTLVTSQTTQTLGKVGMVLLPDGKILLGGAWKALSGKGANASVSGGFALVKYNANGSLDTSFDGDGIAMSVIVSNFGSNDGIRSLALLSDGRIVAVGSTGGNVATVALFKADGKLDTSFGGGDGHVEFSNCKEWWNVTIQPGGVSQPDRILVVGRANASTDAETRPLIARYDVTGALDTTFGSSGFVVETSWPVHGWYFGVEIQEDGKIVAAGGTDVVAGEYYGAVIVARYSAIGALDTSFGNNGIVVVNTVPSGNLGRAYDIAIQADGRFVIPSSLTDASGNTSVAIARFLSGGPDIGSFTASSYAVTQGSSVDLTAFDITDTNLTGTIAQVAFYLDSNNDNALEAGADTLLGYGIEDIDGSWTYTFWTTDLAPGTYTIFAQAQDSFGALSDPLAISLDVI